MNSQKKHIFYMKHTALSLNYFMDEMLSSYHITNQQANLLAQIHNLQKNNEKVTRKKLEQMMNLRGSSVTSLLNGLVKSKFLVRTKGKKDARTMDIRITDQGKQLLKIYANVYQKAQKKMLEGMFEEERELFLNLLKKAFLNLNMR